MSKKNFFMAPEVEKIGKELIRQHHYHLISHGARIEYVFSAKTSRKAGRETWGTARKISSLNAFLASGDSDEDSDDAFFVIVIARPIWLFLTQEQKIALVDHELMHCWAEEDEKTGASKFSIIGHDFEGFNEEIRRHGMWRSDAEQLFSAMKEAEEEAAKAAAEQQEQLPFEGAEANNAQSEAKAEKKRPATRQKSTREIIIDAAHSTAH